MVSQSQGRKKAKPTAAASPAQSWNEQLRLIFLQNGFVHTASAFKDDCTEKSARLDILYQQLCSTVKSFSSARRLSESGARKTGVKEKVAEKSDSSSAASSSSSEASSSSSEASSSSSKASSSSSEASPSSSEASSSSSSNSSSSTGSGKSTHSNDKMKVETTPQSTPDQYPKRKRPANSAVDSSSSDSHSDDEASSSDDDSSLDAKPVPPRRNHPTPTRASGSSSSKSNSEGASSSDSSTAGGNSRGSSGKESGQSPSGSDPPQQHRKKAADKSSSDDDSSSNSDSSNDSGSAGAASSSACESSASARSKEKVAAAGRKGKVGHHLSPAPINWRAARDHWNESEHHSSDAISSESESGSDESDEEQTPRPGLGAKKRVDRTSNAKDRIQSSGSSSESKDESEEGSDEQSCESEESSSSSGEEKPSRAGLGTSLKVKSGHRAVERAKKNESESSSESSSSESDESDEKNESSSSGESDDLADSRAKNGRATFSNSQPKMKKPKERGEPKGKIANGRATEGSAEASSTSGGSSESDSDAKSGSSSDSNDSASRSEQKTNSSSADDDSDDSSEEPYHLTASEKKAARRLSGIVQNLNAKLDKVTPRKQSDKTTNGSKARTSKGDTAAKSENKREASSLRGNSTRQDGLVSRKAEDKKDSEISRKRRRNEISQHRSPGTPFKRIRSEEVVYSDSRLKDNTFYSKNDTFGVKAHNDLVVTRGKGFRKEKTKKKRLNHHGGTLSFQVNSFKFEDDSD
eukprot:GFKZ01007164.1.p1 GENE.GFKZ01007164.1~~GFKZ01007164.1.p1  ORF type:complete len:752 (+),score=138.52 GFKZ01007164.1:2395-4650(+)